MASISSSITIAPTQIPVTLAVHSTGASTSAANDITAYITNPDGTISVTTTDAQGEIVAISTLSAPVVAPISGAQGAAGTSGQAPGTVLNLVA